MTIKKIFLLFILLIGSLGDILAQNSDKETKERLKEFFLNYTTSSADINRCKLKEACIDHTKKTIIVYGSESFGYQPFLPEDIESIYCSVKEILPEPVNKYKLTIYADGRPIEELIPNFYRKKGKDKSRQSLHIDYKDQPWTRNTSRPYEISRGLEGKHIALWQSHGKFFKNKNGEWRWQRPRLFCTSEDLFTQSFVVPYLIPMLENAGAVVFTPRERDTQKHEVIVDNDTPRLSSLYLEVKSKKAKWMNTGYPGFGLVKPYLTDGENPFIKGTARFTRTERKPEKAFAEWIPTIPETGKYAVYVSYQTLPESVTDAKYIVFHTGGVTEFLVNQRIGGGTWVYLGTFEFDKGNNDYCMVVLSNESKEDGVVCADAVRFGGGMGNISRNGVSGVARNLEGARYYAQWAGMPYSVYRGYEGKDDYSDDINTRSCMTNYLAGGSVYNLNQKGLGVPFEIAIGIHSDAGFSKEDKTIGSLGIYTTDYNDGKLGSGISRYASRDLADLMLSGLKRDLNAQFDVPWNRRSMWNRNYSETRKPVVPSMILELLSHQNFADMKLGHDPKFKFAASRSIYKSILRFITSQHGKDYVVQPLPVDHFAVEFGKKKNTVKLSWKPVNDPLEPSAKAQEYIVYTRIGKGGFDNGVRVKDTSYTMKIETGLVYSFKITAVNRGGESFPSEILAAYKAKRSKGTVLIINGFDRLSGPATLETSEFQGFDIESDPGVPYIYTQAFCGYQKGFDRKQIGKETADGLGYSGNELEGKIIAGNTFDYPFVHGKAIQAAGRHSFVSCSDEAVENGLIRLSEYPIIDFILGVEKENIFSQKMQRLLSAYCLEGGNLILSGSFIGSDLSRSPAGQIFMKDILKCSFGKSLHPFSGEDVTGAGQTFQIARHINEKQYAVTHPESLIPVSPAFSAFAYKAGNLTAGIAYKGKDYHTFILGFPFESITSEKGRAKIMAGILHFFKK